MTLSMESRSWFEPLVHQFQRPAFRFALMMTLDRPTAEDVVQEAFARLWAAPNTPSAELGFKRWLYRTITNLARDRHRRRLVESALRLFIPEPANPEDEVVRNASDRELIAALRALNLRERQAIYLRYYEDEPFAQIGDILGVREGTARVIVSRALDKMRRRLNSSEEMTEVLA